MSQKGEKLRHQNDSSHEWMTYFDKNKDVSLKLLQNWAEFRGLNACVHIHFNHHKNEKEMREGRDLKYAGHSGISNPNPLPLLSSSLHCKSPPT